MLPASTKRAFIPLLSLLFLAGPAVRAAEDIPCQWTGVEKTIVIGDIHGDYERFAEILRGTGVIDADLHWAAGTSHFVQTGDVLDRGPDARKIFDLLMRLEKEAEEVGGKVHALLGNHEELNLTGIVFSSNSDYVTLDQFISFLPDSYRRQQEDALRKKILKARTRGRRTSEKQTIDAFWEAQVKDPSAQRLYVLNFNEQYGPWLRRLNVAIKINEVVFVHGGISEKYSKWGLQEINDRYRMELNDIVRALHNSEPPRIAQPSIVYRGDSPLWYRELATVPEEDLKEEVDDILENLGAKVMIIAHTPTIPRTPRDMQRFGGRVWIVDTGISRAYRGPASALIIQNGDFQVWGIGNEKDCDAEPFYFFRSLLGRWPLVPNPAPGG